MLWKSIMRATRAQQLLCVQRARNNYYAYKARATIIMRATRAQQLLCVQSARNNYYACNTRATIIMRVKNYIPTSHYNEAPTHYFARNDQLMCYIMFNLLKVYMHEGFIVTTK